jgi:protein-tyrosine phosphatase
LTVEPFSIASAAMPGGGAVGLCRMPGRAGALADDVAVIAAWSPRIVVSLAQADELAAHGADALPELLARQGAAHRHFPIVDYGAPEADGAWRALAAELHAVLDAGGRALVHCMGGCGRSGMVALRLMVERGEAPPAALARLRAVRPCAVETGGQLAWASAAHHQPAVRPK